MESTPVVCESIQNFWKNFPMASLGDTASVPYYGVGHNKGQKLNLP